MSSWLGIHGGKSYQEFLQENEYSQDVIRQMKSSTRTQVKTQLAVGAATIYSINNNTDALKNMNMSFDVGISRLIASNQSLESVVGNGFNALSGTIQQSLNDLSTSIGNSLYDICLKLNLIIDILTSIDEKLDLVIARLDKIAGLLESPIAIQTREYLKKGIEKYQNGFFAESLIDFNKVQELNNTEYLSFLYKGKIYLFGKNNNNDFLNLKLAQEELKKAKRYCSPYKDKEIIKNIYLEIISLLAFAYYSDAKYSINQRLENIENAINCYKEIISEGVEYTSDMSFNIARCFCIVEDKDKAFAYFKKAFSFNNNTIIKFYADEDLQFIKNEIEKFFIDKYEEIKYSCNQLFEKEKEFEKKYLFNKDHESFLLDTLDIQKVKYKILKLVNEAENSRNVNSYFDYLDSINNLNSAKALHNRNFLNMDDYVQYCNQKELNDSVIAEYERRYRAGEEKKDKYGLYENKICIYCGDKIIHIPVYDRIFRDGRYVGYCRKHDKNALFDRKEILINGDRYSMVPKKFILHIDSKDKTAVKGERITNYDFIKVKDD